MCPNVFCMCVISHFLEKWSIPWALSCGLLYMFCSPGRMCSQTKAFEPKFQLEAVVLKIIVACVCMCACVREMGVSDAHDSVLLCTASGAGSLLLFRWIPGIELGALGLCSSRHLRLQRRRASYLRLFFSGVRGYESYRHRDADSKAQS